MKWLALVLGTLAGGVSRYLLAGVVHRWSGADFPYGTMAVNLAGCFLIGAFDRLAEEKFLLPPNARVLLMTGFCGAFTTFSTFILETAQLVRLGENTQALANVALSVGLGFAFFAAGSMAAKAV